MNTEQLQLQLHPWGPCSLNDISGFTDSLADKPQSVAGNSACLVSATLTAWQQQLLSHALRYANLKLSPYFPDSGQHNNAAYRNLPCIIDVTFFATLAGDLPSFVDVHDTTRELPDLPLGLTAHLKLQQGDKEPYYIDLPTNVVFTDPEASEGFQSNATVLLTYPVPNVKDLAQLIHGSFFLYDPDYEDYSTQTANALRDAFSRAAHLLKHSLGADETYLPMLTDFVAEDLGWCRGLPDDITINRLRTPRPLVKLTAPA